MNKSLLVINTLVFLEQMKEGVKQCCLFKDMYDLGIKNIEVRREFIKDFDKEIEEIKEAAKKYQITLFYSVPENIYEDQILQLQKIEQYFKEAQGMGCNNIKMTIGDYGEVNKKDALELNKLCDIYQINLRIENDQTQENGTLHKIKEFITSYKNLGGEIGVTFDVGNWLWQGEDPAENALSLKEYVTYIHLKDVEKEKPPRTVLLGEGDIDYQNVLKILRKDIPVALEYPCGQEPITQLKMELEKLNLTI